MLNAEGIAFSFLFKLVLSLLVSVFRNALLYTHYLTKIIEVRTYGSESLEQLT